MLYWKLNNIIRIYLPIFFELIVKRNDTGYNSNMIKSFRHKGLKTFYSTGSTKGINPQHANKIKRQLAALDRAIQPKDMNIPGWNLHELSGDLTQHWSVKVNGNWRITFAFEYGEPVLLDYQDYH